MSKQYAQSDYTNGVNVFLSPGWSENEHWVRRALGIHPHATLGHVPERLYVRGTLRVLPDFAHHREASGCGEHWVPPRFVPVMGRSGLRLGRSGFLLGRSGLLFGEVSFTFGQV